MGTDFWPTLYKNIYCGVDNTGQSLVASAVGGRSWISSKFGDVLKVAATQEYARSATILLVDCRSIK